MKNTPEENQIAQNYILPKTCEFCKHREKTTTSWPMLRGNPFETVSQKCLIGGFSVVENGTCDKFEHIDNK